MVTVSASAQTLDDQVRADLVADATEFSSFDTAAFLADVSTVLDQAAGAMPGVTP